MIEEIQSILIKIQTDIIDLVPQLTLTIVILVLGTFVAYILKWLSSSIVKWICKIIPENILNTLITVKDINTFSKLLGRIVFFITIFLTIATALKKLGLEIVSSWFQSIASYLPNTIAALMIFVFGWKLKDFLEEVLFSSLSKVNFSQSKALSKTASWAVFVISTIVALEQIGLNVDLVIKLAVLLSGIIAGGIVLTFSLGAKSNISDILSCYQISRHLKLGEIIKIAEHVGTVKSIGPVFIILDSQEGKIALPGSFFNKNIITIQKKKA